MRTKTLRALTAALPLVALIANGANAVDYDAQVRAGVGVSDNIARTAQNEIDETMFTAGLDFGAVEQSNKLSLNLRANADYIYYDDDTFDEEWVGGLSGLAVFTLIEERLQWTVQDNWGQQLFDPFQPATPGNREDVNYFSTGPTLNLLPASRNSITLSALYSKVNYEERPNDNDRLSGTLSFGRDMSRDSTLSINVSGARVEYDEDQFAPPFENHAAYFRYETSGNRNTLALDIGYTEIEYAGTESDGILFGLDWTLTTSANGLLSVSGGSDYSDQGDDFRFEQEQTPDLGDTADVPNTNAPFRNNYFVLRYALTQERYSLSASVDWNQEDFKGGPAEDRDMYGGNLRYRREVSRKVFASASFDFNRRDYKYQNRKDDDLTIGLDIGYRISPGFDVSLEYQYFKRNSDASAADYNESRAFVRASYTPVWSRKGS